MRNSLSRAICEQGYRGYHAKVTGRASGVQHALLLGGLAVFVSACGPTSSGSGASSGSSSGSEEDAGNVDAGGFPFQPSNISLAEIAQVTAQAADESETGACEIRTDATAPEQDCFTSPIEAVMQADGSMVSLIVVKSLVVKAKGAIRVDG